MRIFAVLFALCLMVTPSFADYAEPLSTVRIQSTKDGRVLGYGSGTYIGNKKILTAAHVVGFNVGQIPVYLDLKFGWKGKIYQAHVDWADPTYDLAVITFDEDLDMVPVPVSCDVAPVGTELRADGFPLRLGRVATWGKVSSAPHRYGPWSEIYLVTMPTVVQGQSGAGVSDKDGNLRGVLVGIPGMDGPGGEGEAFVLGLVFMTSGPSICEAMARYQK